MPHRNVMAVMLAAALLGAASPAVFAANNSPKQNKPCLAVVVGSPQQQGNGGDDDEREFESGVLAFPATKVTDIEFAIVFSQQVATQFTNVHVVEFRVFTPSGNPYQSLTIPITIDPRRAGERHRVPGYPDLVPVQVLKRISHGNGNGLFAKVTLPVAGTPIVSNSLYGTWKADALVEEQTSACGTPALFTISR